MDMRELLIKRIFPISLLLSLLLHFILLRFAVMMSWESKDVEKEKSPDLYTPSYIYKGGMTSAPSVQTRSNITPVESSDETLPAQKSASVNDEAIPLVKQTHKQSSNNKIRHTKKPSVLSMTNHFLQMNQRDMIAPVTEEEPIYLVGDRNSPVDPLIKLLGRALSAHFEYPRTAAAFGIRGRAVVGMTLHPDGRFTHIRLLQSADNQDLDSAALYAVNSAPIVKGVSKFLSKPKYFVIGFVFR